MVKYDRVLTLGAKLGDVRDEIVRRLDEPGLGRDRVLAAAVRMLDVGVFRAGGEQYAPSDDDEDGTFGLATLRREHVSLKRGAVLFSYPAKGNIPRSVALRDPLLHRVVGSLLRRKGGGEELLAYKIKRDWCDVKTADLNGAVKELAGEEYTCKDLRTWNATVLAAVALAAGAAEKGVPGQRARPQADRHRRGEAGRRSTWATPRRWPARPTSTRGCWSGSTRAARCCRRCRSWRAARRDCPRTTRPGPCWSTRWWSCSRAERRRRRSRESFFSAPGLWTASPPLFSLFTRYCGSSFDARTVRPAASVSSVIFFSTVPSAVPPWLFHVTWSPLLNVSRPCRAVTRRRRAHTVCPPGRGLPGPRTRAEKEQ